MTERFGVPETEKPPYEPTPMEAEAIAAYKVAKETRGPRVKVSIEGDAAKINHDHPDPFTGTLAVMRAMGTTDRDFFDGLMRQLVNAGQGKGPSDNAIDFMLSVIRGIEPRDQIEAMLAAQMAAVHSASMTFARRLAHVENIPQQDCAERAFNKLTRTFAAQVEALKRYLEGRATNGRAACQRSGRRPSDRRQCQHSGRGGGGTQKIGGSTPCSCICTRRCDATPNRSGAD